MTPRDWIAQRNKGYGLGAAFVLIVAICAVSGIHFHDARSNEVGAIVLLGLLAFLMFRRK